jgi:hypothetical protein
MYLVVGLQLLLSLPESKMPSAERNSVSTHDRNTFQLKIKKLYGIPTFSLRDLHIVSFCVVEFHNN